MGECRRKSDYCFMNEDWFWSLIISDLRKDKQMAEWIKVSERLPEENEVVLIWVGGVQVARFLKGITEEERQNEKRAVAKSQKRILVCFYGLYLDRKKQYLQEL